MKLAEGIGAAVVSVLGRLLLAFMLWAAVVAFVLESPYARSAPTALSVVVNIGKLVLPIFVLWPLLAVIARLRKSISEDAVRPGRSDD